MKQTGANQLDFAPNAQAVHTPQNPNNLGILRLIDDFVLSQILATIAFAVGLSASLQDNRKKLLLTFSVSASFYAVHLLLLDQSFGFYIALLATTRTLTAAIFPGITRSALFVIIGTLLFVWYSDFVQSYILYLAFLSGTIGAFFKREALVRLFTMSTSLHYLVFNLVIGSPIAVLMEATFFAMNAFGYYRYRNRAKAIGA